MRRACLLAALVSAQVMLSGQELGVLRVSATLLDAAEAAMPVARHALLISDNPASAGPKRVVTAADGTVDVALHPGSYIVESEQPVTLLDKAYEWTVVVDIVAGRETAIALSAGNAAEVALPVLPPAAGDRASRESDPSFLFAKWHASVVAVWSPTSRASGFVIDPNGLIATDQRAIGRATLVEVQVSEELRVPARVVFSSPSTAAAILSISPRVLAEMPPIPLECPSPPSTALDDDDEISTIGVPMRRGADQTFGVVTALSPLAVETDFRLAFGGAGGPVFNESGDVVGLTSLPADDSDLRRRADAIVVRAGVLCEAVAAARAAVAGTAPPEATPLPREPSRPFPREALEAASKDHSLATLPPTVSTSDFDVAILTPPMVFRASQRAGYTGGTSVRSPEAEARLGRLTDFGTWSEYFATSPPVLVVRVAPKLVENFWKRLAREAARTQGAELPPFKDFAASFLRLRASCGTEDVAPIHPFVLEHSVPGRNPVREGIYAFEPDALGPHCGRVTLTLFSEQAPDKGEEITIEPAVIERLWHDFAPYRAASGH